MDAKTQADIIAAAIRCNGTVKQIMKAIEELAELQRALARDLSGEAVEDGIPENVYEEIADVEIMLAQLRMIYDAGQIDDWKDSKLERLARMLGLNIREDAP